LLAERKRESADLVAVAAGLLGPASRGPPAAEVLLVDRTHPESRFGKMPVMAVQYGLGQ
jgi:hypothetical protein